MICSALAPASTGAKLDPIFCEQVQIENEIYWKEKVLFLDEGDRFYLC